MTSGTPATTSTTTFDSTREYLSEILRGIRSRKIQLPDFQRGWVWDNEHIRSLLASVSVSYPIGAVMLLETGNPDVRFKPRVVEGVDPKNAPEPEQFILDGQQRLTSLYLSLFSGEVVNTLDTRGKPMRRWYYLDIAESLDANGDREEAIIALPEDRIVRNFRGEVEKDYSSIEKECAGELFPLPLVFDTVGLTTWQLKYISVDQAHIVERLNRWNDLMQNVIQRFQQYLVPLIVLKKQTPKEAVCQVFEKVNTGGVSLTVFELLTATFAVDNYNLREDWFGLDGHSGRQQRLRKHKVLESLENTDVLQAITLLTTYHKKKKFPDGAVSCKRKDILRLALSDYQAWAEAATIGLEKAAKFLFLQRIFASRDLPYRTQLVPLAAILAVLGDQADSDGVRTKLARWYWCGVFGELYGGAIETRFAKDLPEVVEWINGGPEPTTVQDANFVPSRLYTLRSRNSAAYKGVSAILMREGGLDFRTGDPIDTQIFFEEQIDIHHIFPKSYCMKKGLENREWDSIVNKTPLSSKTNRYIVRADAPSIYLDRIQTNEGITVKRMDEILASHLIDSIPTRKDAFHSFFDARKKALLDRIQKATGKPIAHDTAALVADSMGDEPSDNNDDDPVTQ